MKMDQIKVGATYSAKVSGGVVPVRITQEVWRGEKLSGWDAVNTTTNRPVRIKSAQRLRAEVKENGKRKAEPATKVAPTIARTDPATIAPVPTPAPEAAATPPATPDATVANVGEPVPGSTSKAKPEADESHLIPLTQAMKPAKPKKAAKQTKPAKEPKVAKEPKAAKTPKQPKATKPKRLSCLDAAAIVLAKASKPMRSTEMIAEMQAKGLWKSPSGKTPEASLYAAVIREIAAKGRDSRFKKADKGLFTAGKGA